MVDGVIMYACIGSGGLASILVGALVVACRRRSTQARNVTVASSNHRLQPRLQIAVDKHRLSAFDAYVSCTGVPSMQQLPCHGPAAFREQYSDKTVLSFKLRMHQNPVWDRAITTGHDGGTYSAHRPHSWMKGWGRAPEEEEGMGWKVG